MGVVLKVPDTGCREIAQHALEAARRQRATSPWIYLRVLDSPLHLRGGEDRVVLDDLGGALPAGEGRDDVDRDISSAQHGFGRGLIDQRLPLLETLETLINAAIDFC